MSETPTSRCHWRFIVRNSQGRAIQNAAVFVHPPGTTDNYLGAAYTTQTGGVGLPNPGPLITNDQGEVEGYFTDRQPVDVVITDNGGAAYLVGNPENPITFASVTERDDIRQHPNDSLAGDAGSLAAAIVNPFTSQSASAGTVGRPADAGHVHPYSALSPSTPLAPRTGGSTGTATAPARGNHRHPMALSQVLTSQFTQAVNTSEQVVLTLTGLQDWPSAGSTFAFFFKAFHSNGTTASTITFRIRFGGLTGVELINQAFVGTTTAHTDTPVNLEGLVTFRTIGSSGTAICSIWGQQTITSTGAALTLFSSALSSGVTVDTTSSAADLTLTVQMSATTGMGGEKFTAGGFWQVA